MAAHVKGRLYEADPQLFGDLDRCRIDDMDRHGITMQILSCPAKSQLLPVDEAAGIVSETNDFIADVVKNIWIVTVLLHFCLGPIQRW